MQNLSVDDRIAGVTRVLVLSSAQEAELERQRSRTIALVATFVPLGIFVLLTFWYTTRARAKSLEHMRLWEEQMAAAEAKQDEQMAAAEAKQAESLAEIEKIVQEIVEHNEAIGGVTARLQQQLDEAEAAIGRWEAEAERPKRRKRKKPAGTTPEIITGGPSDEK
jgi:hypothetical protein